MISPTIGRRVWYWPNGVDNSVVTYGGKPPQPCDAGIAYVWNDRLINISVVDHGGTIHSRTSVKLLQAGDDRPADKAQSFAEWMPYQAGQAKKNEAAS